LKIVFTNLKDSPADIAEPDTKTTAIAKHILSSLKMKFV
jgi:acetyl-CoA hydrolase/succinyl-CoA:acetate CoA-transferase